MDIFLVKNAQDFPRFKVLVFVAFSVRGALLVESVLVDSLRASCDVGVPQESYESADELERYRLHASPLGHRPEWAMLDSESIDLPRRYGYARYQHGLS